MHEVKDPAQRIKAIAKENAKSSEKTLVVSPNNRFSAEINARILIELQATEIVGREERRIDTLVPRQDLTGADRTWAQRYERDNLLLHSRSLKETGVEKGGYAHVKDVAQAQAQAQVREQDKNEQSIGRGHGMGL